MKNVVPYSVHYLDETGWILGLTILVSLIFSEEQSNLR